METTHKEIKTAAEQFKKALKSTGKKDVVIIYSYKGKAEESERKEDVIFTSFVADVFTQVLATCDLVKHDLLNGGE